MPDSTVSEVFKEHYPYVLRLATSLTGDYEMAKDISTAKEMEFFLLACGKKDDFIFYFKKMPKKWRSDILNIIKENESDLVDIFKNIE